MAWLKTLLSPLIFLALSAPLFAASANPDLLKAKQEAEVKGYIFETTHEEIVAKAKKEGRLRVLISLDPKAFPHLISAFRKRYSFIDVMLEEITGADAAQRFVLELKAGRVKEWDVMHMSADTYHEYEGHKKEFDIVGMAREGVLQIPAGMMDQKKRNAIFSTSVFSVVAYNQHLLPAAKVPDKWEDFLKPEFKGGKFAVEIRGGVKDLAALIPSWGLERLLNYAKRLAAQGPVWSIGYTRALGSMVAGELGLLHMVNWHSTVRAQAKDRRGSLAYKIVEPVPARLTVSDAVVKSAPHPYSGLLWIEFLAGPDGQAIIDKFEPLKSNLYAPGSEVAKALKGKTVSVTTPEEAEKMPEWMATITAALGFPKVETKK